MSAPVDARFSNTNEDTTRKEATNVTQLMARIAKEAANKDEPQEVPEHANRYHWADGPRLRHENRAMDSWLEM